MHCFSSAHPCRPYEKNERKTKQTTLVVVFSAGFARSHANMLVNNKFGLLYECSIFEASESAAVFAR